MGGSDEAHAPQFFQTRRHRCPGSRGAGVVRACLGAGQAAADWNYCAAVRRRRHRGRVRNSCGAMGGRADEQGRRHRRAQDRIGVRRRDQPKRYDRALSTFDSAGKGRGGAWIDLDRRQPRGRAGGGGRAGASGDVGRHHAGRRQGNDAESTLRFPLDRQRMRSGDGIAAGDQVFQGQVQAGGRHQSRLFLWPQQLGSLQANPGALRRRGGVRRRTMAEGRDDGSDLAYRGPQGGQARSDLFLHAVRRSACLHEAGPCGGPVRRRQDGAAGGRLADQPAQEGIHAGRRGVRTQHALFRSSAGLSAAKGIRCGLHGSLQGSAALGGGQGVFRTRQLQGRCRSCAKGGEQVAQAMPGLEVEILGGKGRFRKDKIAEQVFYQGPSTNTNKYDFPTLASIDTFQAEQLQKPLGAYFGITAVGLAIKLGMPPLLFFPVLIIAGLAIGLVGLPIERVLRTIYRRDESYQLLITFGLLLMFQDAFRYLWGATPRTMDNVYLAYGTAHILGVRVPTYNLLVIAASLAIAVGLGLFLERTNTGRIVRATAENREMAEGLGVNASKIFALVFTVGCMLGAVGGALVVPSGAGWLDIAVGRVVGSFVVVGLGGRGSMRAVCVCVCVCVWCVGRRADRR